MSGAWWVWPVAGLLYGAFRLWYDNWHGPLRADEIDAFLSTHGSAKLDRYSDPAVVRAFLEADDGREFIMSNLVRAQPGEVAHPHTGTASGGQALLQEYGRHFVGVLLRHGGHPVMVMRKIGGYLDAWNTPPDPGWHVVGAMRYRSRRDLLRLAADPALAPVHQLKTSGVEMTFSFPARVMVSTAAGPRVWVALALALLASVLHLLSLLPR